LRTAAPPTRSWQHAPVEPVGPVPGFGIVQAPQAPPAGASAPDIAEALRAQAAALHHLVARQSRRDPTANDESSEEDMGTFRGARGAMAMEKHRRLVARHPERIVVQMREARNAALCGPAQLEGVTNSYRGYFASEVPFGKARTAAYLVFGLCEVADLMEAGKAEAAHATVLLLLAAAEQAALHEWHWPPAWLLTHLPEPPFSRISHAPQRDMARPLSRLADPRLVAASMAYLRDIATVAEAGRRRGPHPAADEPTGQQPKAGVPAPGGPKANPKGPRGGPQKPKEEV